MDRKEMLAKLEQYPELANRFEELIRIIENPQEETTLADVAEDRIIWAVRQLGYESLKSWAQAQAAQVSLRLKQQVKGTNKHIKKKSTGGVVLEKSK